MLNAMRKIREKCETIEEKEENKPLSQFVKPKINISKRPILEKLKAKNIKLSRIHQNEPKKPLSPYSQFFKDTQKSIKIRNPKVTFTEVTQVVTSMWETLDEPVKKHYEMNYECQMRQYKIDLLAYQEKNVEKVKSEDEKPEIKENEFSEKESLADEGNTTEEEATGISTDIEEEKPNIYVKSEEISSPISPKNEYHSPLPSPREEEEEETKIPVCIKEGCINFAIPSLNWDYEYCSAKCLIEHCHNAFKQWVQKKQEPQIHAEQTIS